MNVEMMSSTDYIQHVFNEARKLQRLATETTQQEKPRGFNNGLSKKQNDVTAYLRDNLRNQALTPEHLQSAKELQPQVQQKIDELQAHIKQLEDQKQTLQANIDNSSSDYAKLIADNNYDDAAILEKKNQDKVNDIASLERQIKGFVDAINLISPELSLAERIVDQCKFSLLDQAYTTKKQAFNDSLKVLRQLYDECNALHSITTNTRFGLNQHTADIEKMLKDDSFFYQKKDRFINDILHGHL